MKKHLVLCILCTLCCVAYAQKIKIKTGIEVLKEQNFKCLEGKRVGLITNPTGVDNHMKSTIDILHEAPNVNLVALYGPEHGVRGDVHAGDHVTDIKDASTGLPVYSLYGKTRKATPEMLKDIDVLVSTTIIETGLDISNVNTIIIHDSDNMGLSQLYQLRGRVGRSNRTSYAFLMYKKDKMLKEVAEKRLAAIKEFTDLGSGFKIAMRDLEIRGAGNLLGASQHGHMQAVGYDLYCKMLNEAVKTLKGIPTKEDFLTTVDLDVDAFIPPSYIVNEVQKLDIYKRIAGIENQAECDDMKEELLDRFGEIPVPVHNLLRIALIRSQAHRLYITELKGKNGEIKLLIKADARIHAERIPELLGKVEKLSFNIKLTTFVYHYQRSGVAEKDARSLLQETEEILNVMEEVLLR